MGFARDEKVPVVPTPWVWGHAKGRGIPAERAWYELDRATRVGDDGLWHGLRLIDARLLLPREVADDRLPPVLRVFHDLRPMPPVTPTDRMHDPLRFSIGKGLREALAIPPPPRCVSTAEGRATPPPRGERVSATYQTAK